MCDPIDLVQRSDAGQQCEFFPVERWDTQGKILG